MLFNSSIFIGVFLPIALTGWWGLKQWAGIRIALSWLVIASLFFYAAWDPRYLVVLLTSVSINFWLGGRILAAKTRQADHLAKRWMIAGVGFNLLVLGGFKYAYFVASNLFAIFSLPPPFEPLLLPLAISFVTFQKIAYLVDCRRGVVARHDALEYLFFVSFFPQLIAGPIVHHRPLIAQTVADKNPLFKQTETVVAGLTLFAIGLFKKVVLADSIAHYASPVFELAKRGMPGGEAAWQAMLAYTLQLYFDFSGYSDMAIGLALMFGFRLPVNFLSPYKSASIIEFWRRWHITLSTFLRDYLYIPLGGNRHGPVARYRNLWLTMLLAGLWHGAGWNFLLWGALHGSMLLLNHAWRAMQSRFAFLATIWRHVPAAFSVTVTFLLVAFAWVLFRSNDLSTASHLYQALAHPLTGDRLAAAPWRSAGALLEGLSGVAPEAGWIWISAGMLIVLAAPNSVRLVSYDAQPNTGYRINLRFGLGVLAGACLWFGLKWMAVRPATEFLYFNF
ncbi:MBOAT family O-acyltransferase [Undibacterium sp.]|uniref:MBOAT family O-acyltransferase n=1 Tax=Undibacterium sp. TaxID=1914977 RepID=UPI00374DA74F